MKKIFISQPMKGLTQDQILSQRDTAIKALIRKYGEIELIDTYFKDFDGNRLQFLGKSISEGLALADVACFIGDWYKFDGCRAEQFTASQYGVEQIFFNGDEA